MENLHEGKKQYLKNKTKDLMIQKLVNQFIRNLVHCHRLELQKYFQLITQTLGDLIPKKWHLNSVKPQFLYYLQGYRKKKVAIPFKQYFERDVLTLHIHLVAPILYNKALCLALRYADFDKNGSQEALINTNQRGGC